MFSMPKKKNKVTEERSNILKMLVCGFFSVTLKIRHLSEITTI